MFTLLPRGQTGSLLAMTWRACDLCGLSVIQRKAYGQKPPIAGSERVQPRLGDVQHARGQMAWLMSLAPALFCGLRLGFLTAHFLLLMTIKIWHCSSCQRGALTPHKPSQTPPRCATGPSHLCPGKAQEQRVRASTAISLPLLLHTQTRAPLLPRLYPRPRARGPHAVLGLVVTS